MRGSGAQWTCWKAKESKIFARRRTWGYSEGLGWKKSKVFARCEARGHSGSLEGKTRFLARGRKGNLDGRGLGLLLGLLLGEAVGLADEFIVGLDIGPLRGLVGLGLCWVHSRLRDSVAATEALAPMLLDIPG